MFVLSSARLPRLTRLQPLARQRGTGTRFQPHSGLLRGEGRLPGSWGPEPSLWSLWSGLDGAVVQRTLTVHRKPQTFPSLTRNPCASSWAGVPQSPHPGAALWEQTPPFAVR